MASRSVARTLSNAMSSTSRSRSVRASCASCRFYATPATSSTASSSSTAAATPELSSSAAVSPKISQIVDQISTLSLLEAAELVSTLKTRLNIADIAVAAPAAAAPAGAAAAGGEAAAEAEKPKEKTVFTVTLTKIDAAQKAKVIKEVKAVMPNMNLVEAKKFVENLPQTLKENSPKDDVEKLKKALEAVGASVEIS